MSDYLIARQRPIGVSLLSILALLGGILLLAVAAFAGYYIANSTDAAIIQSRLVSIGIPLPLLIAGLAFLIVIGLGSGLGLWSGRKWGWHLAAFGYAYAIARNLNAILVTYQIIAAMPTHEVASMPHTPAYYYIKFSGRVIVSALIYLYLFKSNVLEYFQLTEMSRWKVVVADFSICAAIVAVVSIAAAQLQ